jgi:hypothetical protein
LSAFALMVTVVVFSAFALGAAADGRVLLVSNVLWAIGGIGTLVFGIWLAIYVKGYEVWDGWVIAAIVLWFAANGLGSSAQAGFAESADEAKRSRAPLMHWLRSVAVLALLVVMIYKPGA